MALYTGVTPESMQGIVLFQLEVYYMQSKSGLITDIANTLLPIISLQTHYSLFESESLILLKLSLLLTVDLFFIF